MSATDKIRRELLGEFQQCSKERLERVAIAWVALENEPAKAGERGALIMRELHTLKGEAKLMGFGTLSSLAHRFEDLIVSLERVAYRRASEFGDLALRAVDLLNLLALTDSTATSSPAVEELEGKLAAASAQLVTSTHPTVIATAPPPVQDLPRAGAPEPLTRDAFVRVDVATAHRLAEEASEIVLAHARYRHAAANLRASIEDLGSVAYALNRLRLPVPGPLGAIHERLTQLVDQLADDVHQGDLIARTLELDARRLRLVPIAPLFRNQARAVRELARDLGKRATLQIIDGGIAVDREVVERLGAPLVHLLRNALDHGLETPAARAAAGKPESGTITLTAERSGNEVLVIVEDDGAGVDLAAVRARAVARGIIDAKAELAEAELLGLLFAAGFSTREATTETSGRGVGLDVVKCQAESLGGAVRISSEHGRGTRFELRVPISVALSRALIVEENGRRFAIPHTAVDAVIGVDAGAIELIHTRRHIAYRGARIPIVELATALQLQATSVSTTTDLRALVIRHEEQRVAILVDAWHGDAEVVVKPLDALASSRAVIGACTLESGQVALVLSPAELVTKALGESPRVRAAAHVQQQREERRILLVEDSAITRTMVAQLLRMLGYNVAEAEDGARALRVLEDFNAEAVITDVEMPEIDGIELIKRLRADARWRSLPVIVLSTRGSNSDKQRAVIAGADAYLVKTEFSESALRDVLARHLAKG